MTKTKPAAAIEPKFKDWNLRSCGSEVSHLEALPPAEEQNKGPERVRSWGCAIVKQPQRPNGFAQKIGYLVPINPEVCHFPNQNCHLRVYILPILKHTCTHTHTHYSNWQRPVFINLGSGILSSPRTWIWRISNTSHPNPLKLIRSKARFGQGSKQ